MLSAKKNMIQIIGFFILYFRWQVNIQVIIFVNDIIAIMNSCFIYMFLLLIFSTFSKK